MDAFSTPPKLLAPFTLENFRYIWVEDGFWQYALNTTIVTALTMAVSLTIGCLAAYALSRYRGSIGFWLLIAALIFRAMPHVVLLDRLPPGLLRAWDLEPVRDADHRAGRDQPALHHLDAARLFHEHPTRSWTRRRWSTAAPALAHSGV